MIYLIASVVAFGLVIIFMSLGYIIKKKKIEKNCGNELDCLCKKNNQTCQKKKINLPQYYYDSMYSITHTSIGKITWDCQKILKL